MCGAAGRSRTLLTAREPGILQGGEERRRAALLGEVLAQDEDQALLHQRLRHGLGADTRLRDLRQQSFEGVPDDVAGRDVLHDGLRQILEQAQGAAIGGRDRAADNEGVTGAVASGELHQPVVDQLTAIIGPRFPEHRDRFAEALRGARRNDDDVVAENATDTPVPIRTVPAPART